MKKKFRNSEIYLVLGDPEFEPELHQYGLPYTGAGGLFIPALDPEYIDNMRAAQDLYFPEFHVVSFMDDRSGVNRFEENADYYCLYRGNPDPEIEFSSEFLVSDLPPGSADNLRKLVEEVHTTIPTVADQRAVDWAVSKLIRPRS